MRAALWWIDRWRKSTAFTDMTLAEQGAYRNLLDEMWLRPVLPADERILGKIAGSETEWPSVRTNVLRHFIRVEGGWTNETATDIIRTYERFRQKQRTNGQLGGRPKKPTNKPTHNPNASQYISQNQTLEKASGSGSGSVLRTPDPVQKISKRQTASHGNGSAVSEGFDRFWAAYPNKKHKDAARKAWAKRMFSPNQLDAVLASIAEQVTWPEWTKDGGQFIPHPATWLNGGCWQDEPRTAGPDPLSDQAITAAMKALLKHAG